MLFILVCFYIASLFAFSDADPAEIKFKISLNDKFSTNCDQNVTNINEHQINVTEGTPLKIIVDYGYYVNYLQCDKNNFNSSHELWKPKGYQQKVTTVPQVTKEMDGVWYCTILSLKDVKWVFEAVHFEGHTYVPAFCAVKVNVKSETPEPTVPSKLACDEEVKALKSEINILKGRLYETKKHVLSINELPGISPKSNIVFLQNVFHARPEWHPAYSYYYNKK